MGATISKVDQDKALLLCRERRSHVRQALDGRCSLAEAHTAYIQALANMGMALGKVVDSESPNDSSLYNFTSTSGTHYPNTCTDKSISQFSNSCPSPSQQSDTLCSFSPTASRLHVNCMRSSTDFSTTFEEKPPVSVTATLTPSPNLHETPWDYFGLFHPIDDRFSLHDGRETTAHVSDVSDSVDHIRRLREEEGIPDLEEELDKSPVNGKSDHVDSEDDDFDQPSSETLVQIYKNRTETLDLESIDGKLAEKQIGDETTVIPKNDDAGGSGTDITDMDRDASMSPPHPPPSPSTVAAVPTPTNENRYTEKETILESNKNFLSNMKEIEQLFRKASESGKEVPMMLEANAVNFRPSLPEIQVHRSNAPLFLNPLFVCFRPRTYNIKEAVSNETKYMSWHRSTSSISASEIPVPVHNHLRDGVSSELSGICMNFGSHASTLDRLYAWERKLYDEVKASGIVRKEYDLKCKRLRELDSRSKQLDFRGENSNKIDRTRAVVKDLHSRIGVAIHRIESISKTIEKLRDRELQPQLEELIGGLSRMWKTMVECYAKQLDIISTLTSNGNSNNVTMQFELNREAVVVLEYQLNTLCSSFTNWISSHQIYLCSINHWLHRCCVFPEGHKSTRRRNQSELSYWKENSPPIYATCGDWLEELDKLPVEQVEKAIKALATHFVPHHHQNNTGDISLSLSRKTDTTVNYNIARNNQASPVSWSLDLEKLQTELATFINRLMLFSQDSVNMYEKLHHSITEAHKRYQIPGTSQKERSR